MSSKIVRNFIQKGELSLVFLLYNAVLLVKLMLLFIQKVFKGFLGVVSGIFGQGRMIPKNLLKLRIRRVFHLPDLEIPILELE